MAGKNQEDGPLKELIDRFLKAYRLDSKMKEMDVINGWSELMGPAIAHRTEQLKIRNQVLIVKMNSSVMRDELQRGKQIIILRVNEFAGFNIIKDVWFE